MQKCFSIISTVENLSTAIGVITCLLAGGPTWKTAHRHVTEVLYILNSGNTEIVEILQLPTIAVAFYILFLTAKLISKASILTLIPTSLTDTDHRP